MDMQTFYENSSSSILQEQGANSCLLWIEVGQLTISDFTAAVIDVANLFN